MLKLETSSITGPISSLLNSKLLFSSEEVIGCSGGFKSKLLLLIGTETGAKFIVGCLFLLLAEGFVTLGFNSPNTVARGGG